MSATVDKPGMFARLGAILADELAPFPGRGTAVLRFWLSFSLVIVCSMALEVPFVSLSLLFVFFTAQENTLLTRLAGVILIIGAILADFLPILVFNLTINYPLLRIATAAGIAFAGLYFMRASKLGVIGFMVSIAVLYSQSFVDFIESPEQLTRLALWALPAAVYGTVVTLVVNLLLFPAHPEKLLTKEMLRQLGHAIDQLRALREGLEAPELTARQVERSSIALHRHLASSARASRSFDQHNANQMMHVAAIDRIHTLAYHLASQPRSARSEGCSRSMAELIDACEKLGDSLQKGQLFSWRPNTTQSSTTMEPLEILLLEIRHELLALVDEDRISASALPHPKEGLWVEDAFTNPVYARFAFKAVFAALLGYVFYMGMQWTGIHTVLLTCVILALPSVGASSHKGITRILGCVLGSVCALVATVFLIPKVDGIVGLLLISSPVFLAGAWIAAGSSRTNYIGVQLVFSYALALYGSFGPTTDVTEIRDRMLGILLGVILYVSISLLVWPEREGDQLRLQLSKLLRSIADLARVRGKAASRPDSPASENRRLAVWKQINQNRDLQARVALEPGWQFAHDSVTGELTSWLSKAQETALSIDLLQTQVRQVPTDLPASVSKGCDEFLFRCAARLEQAADRIASDEPGSTTSVPNADADAPAYARLNDASAQDSRLQPLLAAARAVEKQINGLEASFPTGIAAQSSSS
jgi:multidrug resistance protein MdtO